MDSLNNENLIGLYDRTEKLIGSESMLKLKNSKVLVVGLGGVGGYIVEALARAGVGTIGLCDFDIADVTNLNRQILVLSTKIGQKKTDLAKDRVLEINPNCITKIFDFRLNSDKLTELNIQDWDYIADAIDDTKAKIALIQAAYNQNVPIISSMGTGNKINPFEFKIVPIEKTEGDPLARSIRKQLKDLKIQGIPVLYSSETPVCDVKEAIPTISYMPAVAGLEIASYIIKKIIK
ncbi:MAG: ThiF family adenylyltransferase [Bacillota bacterium]|nr:ThiF family adenylyltransferase [Bacillota bacterium]